MTEHELMMDLEDAQSSELCHRYESQIITEARAIAEGRSMKLATAEHLRVVLSWLDGGTPAQTSECPF